jgi:hypothetical protein
MVVDQHHGDPRGSHERNATQSGAERVARCWVQKVSNLILNINIEARSLHLR